MSTHSQQIVQRLWNYCNILRDDGVSYGDYVEQLTYLLFLKMAHERTLPPYNQPSHIPIGYDWENLTHLDGDELEKQYRHTLEKLSSQPGILGIIFRKAVNKIQNPAHLRRLIVNLIDKEQWTVLDTDVTGDAYEGLLEKNAEDTKSGAGQYFTPRPLIRAVVDVMQPNPWQTICDPACGTGGFLLAAYDYILKHYQLDDDERDFLKLDALRGWEIVDNTARLCAMNFFLHGIGSDEDDGRLPIHVADSLRCKPNEHYDMVFTNPPFGRKSSIAITNRNGGGERDTGTIERDDFWASTSNKQLIFVQHVNSLLSDHGRAAIVIPDNVLFEGGAGEIVRRRLLDECDVHTLLRLPTGIFYAQNVKANVLFFNKKPISSSHWSKRLWVYDLRTNLNFTLRNNPLTRAQLDEFVACFHSENRDLRQESERFHSFSYDELIKRDRVSLDLTWLVDESLEGAVRLSSPDILAASIVEDLQVALEQFTAISEDLGDMLTKSNINPITDEIGL